MAKEDMESVKKYLLMGFVLACVVLIVLIWAQGLADSGMTGSGAVQASATLSGTPYSTRTATPERSFTNTPVGETGEDQATTPDVVQGGSAAQTPTPDMTQTWLADQYNG